MPWPIHPPPAKPPIFTIEPCCHEEHGVFYVMKGRTQIEAVCFSRDEAKAKLEELREKDKPGA